jgi:hypothetical protein
MKYIAVTEPRDVPFLRVYNYADWHKGEKGFNQPELEKALKDAEKDPHTRIIVGGDFGNFVTPGSVGEMDEQTATADEQIDYCVDVLRPVRDKIWCILDGNHPARVKKGGGVRPGHRIARELGIPDRYSIDTGYVVVRMGHRENGKPWVYSLYVKHGAGGGTTTGGKAAEVERGANVRLAHVFWNAHLHGKILFDDVLTVPDFRQNKLVQWRRLYMRTASFLDYPGYAEEKGYRMCPLGSPELLLSGKAFWYDASLLPRRDVPGLSA